MTINKKRLLFVDDEPAVLDSLRDSLRKHRAKYDMSFEQYPQKALERLAQEKFDVVISDMRMPEMDGAELLSLVRQQHPATVRIVLSGFTELEVAIRAVSVAHQFLTKPCEADYLDAVVERACTVQNLLLNDELKAVVGKMETLPTTPQIFAEISEAMASPNATAHAVAKIIERDPSMCAKLLQMSNSGFFRLARPISKVEDAIVYLGYNMIKNLVLSTEVFSRTLTGKKRRAFQRELQEHSSLTAHIALQIAPERRVREDAFLAAILHDIGQIVLASEHEEYPDKVLNAAVASEKPFLDAEREIYGVTHAQVGAYLLGLWGVPFNVVEAVAYHHGDESALSTQSSAMDALGTVALANALAEEVTSPKSVSANAMVTTNAIAQRVGRKNDLMALRTQASQSVKLAKAV